MVSYRPQEEDASRTREKYDTVKKDEQERRKLIEKLEREVAQLENKVSAKLEPVDYAPIQAEIVSSALVILLTGRMKLTCSLSLSLDRQDRRKERPRFSRDGQPNGRSSYRT